jgi:hypothetical protein
LWSTSCSAGALALVDNQQINCLLGNKYQALGLMKMATAIRDSQDTHVTDLTEYLDVNIALFN